METAPLKSFATWARRELITQVSARLTAVLAPASSERVEKPRAVTMLERDIAAAGGGAKGKDAVADKVAYTWFNRIIALRFMDANGYTGVGVVSPAHGQQTGQPEVLADAKRGNIDPAVVSNKRTLDTIIGLLDGTRPSADAQSEAYTLLLAEYCRYWNRSMPFMFEREGDYTELLIPANLLAADSILTRAAAVLTQEVSRDVEVIGWLYQFYISERKSEVFAEFKKGKKAGATEIPAATQLFTPHWIVRYLVENSLGRLWMLNHPSSRLADQMDYYIAPVDEETDFLKICSPEELKVIDPACGSGHMLTYAFDLLYAIYEEEGYAPSEIPESILTHNLYGTEIDPRAGALAAFALTMKSRARQRTFFGKRVEPNICVIDPISFSPDELDYLVTPDGDRSAEGQFWNQFTEADSLGSLIKPDRDLTVRLAEHLATLNDEGDILRADALDWAASVIRQAEFLASRYSVVVANPPYMGSRNSSPTLSEFAAQSFPDTRMDLYAMFIERGLGLTVHNGLTAMVTMESWMFIRSFESLRQSILSNARLLVMAHLGPRAFDSIAGEVVGTTAFVIERSPENPERQARFVRAVGPKSEAAKAKVLREVASGAEFSDVYDRTPSAFVGVNGAPLAYWLPEQVLAAMVESRQMHDVVSFPTSPHKTGDNGTYVRRWWEVSAHDLGPRSRWVPYAKGGGARRWFGLMYDVVDWSASALRYYSENSSSSHMKRNPDAPLGVTYSMLTSGTNTFRVLPEGAAFDMGGPGFFSHRLSLAQTLAVVNSDMTRLVLDALNPTLNLQVREVKQIPVPDFGKDEESHLDRLAVEAIAIAEEDWNSHECSIGFLVSPLVALGDGRVRQAAESYYRGNVEATERLAEVERSVDRLMWSAAGVPVEERGGEAARAILFANAELEHGPGKSSGEYQSLTSAEAVADLVSYAVGCMFGRYSLDEPGLILADQGATVQDYLAKVPTPTFVPDADNVLPIVDGDWFEDDIVARFRQFLRAAFGEQHFEENLRFVEESLGVKSLREYFITRAGRSKFYDDHVQRYKKRPIYWLFSSPKGSFNALIYMHRYTPSTVSTVLNEYLREFESKLEANLQHQERLAAGRGTPREKAAALKESDRLRKVLLELGEYEHDVLYPLASQQIAIDLDDGVRANYPKLYPALKKITGLESADE
ncbi:BREX-1 system adenine-specific DNA-methyltransferase PglX [Tessaracoccus sp. MC1679]|uniref:BREX-1 system adenine-specific DNA-methyltransferase PglX n=1 Tax=Tessaracoccus sp. MC1679 TaxID=2760313 RepID=UPI001600DCB1|nr:BREX-1 system adenine-specific DNA-methyltransferase PglX [Tessaracoccus sp. MC1679]MBB1515747.1 BREX-1 system adenine-specific DNA-methyltransferase PglX [Tessaracoccus sp. MC1679]